MGLIPNTSFIKNFKGGVFVKKWIAVFVAVVMVASVLAGCGGGGAAAKYKDGIYFAQQDKFDEKTGWKTVVTLEVKDGKIVKADWNAANIKGGVDKKTASKEGKYGMKEKGKAIAEWHEQAEKVEEYLLKNQDPAKITYKDNEGHTDAISGATVHVNDFFDLAKKALDAGPVGKGKYKDGPYHAEQKEFAEKSGWKSTVDLTVINGTIVAAYWSGVHKDGGDDKYKQSKDGKYGMKEKGKASAEWHEQADKVTAYFLEKQDPESITYKDNEGHTDAISGATIHVNDFFELAKEALAAAK